MVSSTHHICTKLPKSSAKSSKHFPRIWLSPKIPCSNLTAGPVSSHIGGCLTLRFAKLQVAASDHFLRDVFMPEAESAGAEVKPVVVAVHNDSSSNIGAAICHYAATVKADALVLMRENKSAVARFFLGSVTKYCAAHSLTPIVIVPNKSL